MVNRKILLSVTVVAMLTLSVGVAWADEVTSEINYQGRLADSSGSPLSGTYTMTFRLYEAATGGTALARGIHDVVVTDGLFNKELNFDQSYFDGRALWLGVKVGADSEMTPRQEFRPVPYALSLVPGAKIMGAAQWNLNAETTHASGRALRGQASATSGTNYGVVGASRSPDGYGGYFYNNEGGVGVYGRGGKYAGYFDGNVYVSDNLGIGTTKPGTALHIHQHYSKPQLRISDNKGYWQFWGGANFHISEANTDRFFIAEGGNVGIGTASAASKLTVREGDLRLSKKHVQTNSSTWEQNLLFADEVDRVGAKISSKREAWNSAPMGLSFYTGGMNTVTERMTIKSNGNVGIGTTSPKEKLDVRGRMIVGGSDFKLGVYDGRPQGDKKSNRALVHDLSDLLVINYAGDFEGGVRVQGPSFSVSGTKNFLIDHPLDPEHKELVHSTLEGPEAGVFYRGEAQLSNGEATVTLPDYFEALTREEDRTVLLTPKFEGDEQVSMLAASGVKDGKFRVRMIDSKNPSQKFYWEVKAVRADVEILEVEKTKPPAQ